MNASITEKRPALLYLSAGRAADADVIFRLGEAGIEVVDRLPPTGQIAIFAAFGQESRAAEAANTLGERLDALVLESPRRLSGWPETTAPVLALFGTADQERAQGSQVVFAAHAAAFQHLVYASGAEIALSRPAPLVRLVADFIRRKEAWRVNDRDGRLYPEEAL